MQGNSIATMLARKEGFSIWDLQDIARQTCQGLDHAHSHHVVHYSLEPAKIMVTWDGTVKVLGFGISVMGAHASQATGAPPDVLHYMSPEQLSGDPLDGRSNIFSLGAILYEMVTERKAFSGEDADQVRQSILEMTPVAPDQINRKTHPVLSQVIMKALAKAPEERYQSGQDLVNDLERCKESAGKAGTKKTAEQPAQGLNVPKAPVAAKAAPAIAVPAAQVTSAVKREPVATPAPVAKVAAERVEAKSAAPEKKAAAAAAGWGGESSAQGLPRMPKLDPSAQFISTCVKASVEAATRESEQMSAATAAPETETPQQTSKAIFDPMMSESATAAAASRQSFSEIDELPPLKEAYVAPPPPPPMQTTIEPADEVKSTVFAGDKEPEKPKIQPREVAKKAVTEIKKTPPKLFGYAIAGAVGLILLVIVAIAFRIRSENSDDDSGPAQTASTAAAGQAQSTAAAPQPVTTQAPAPVQSVSPITAEPTASVSVKPKVNAKKKAVKEVAPEPVAIPGQLTINSTPEGAQIHVDGRTDTGWITPYNMPGLAAGQHTVTVSKPGFSSETRTLEVASGSKSFLVVQLAALTAAVSVTSDPAGAAIFSMAKIPATSRHHKWPWTSRAVILCCSRSRDTWTKA